MSRIASTALGAIGAIGARRDDALRVLVYHRVSRRGGDCRGDPHVLSATPDAFDEQMRYIARYYEPVTASRVVSALRGEQPLPPRAVLVTFDDGYRDVLTNAWPVLKHHSVPALLFVPTAFPGTSRSFWWDDLYEMVAAAAAEEIRLFGLGPYPLRTAQERWVAVRALNRALKHLSPAELLVRLEEVRAALDAPELERPPIVTWDELRAMVAEGLAVGSHTQTHPAVPFLSEEQLVKEVRGAHADLVRELGQVSPLFSYPFGLADPRVVPVLRESGYVAAFISLVGRNVVGRRNPFLLYRHSVDLGHSLVRFAVSLTDVYVRVRESGRAVKARLSGTLQRAAITIAEVV